MDDPLEIRDPDRALALAYAAPSARAGLAALWALDERLAAIVAATREPALGLMRLLWWRDALDALAAGPPRGEPLLAACAAAGLDGPTLAAMVAGWEAVIEDPELGGDTLAAHAGARGGGMFVLAGGLLGASAGEEDRLRAAGEGWALADLARRRDGRVGAVLRDRARETLDRAMATRWPRALRPLGQLAILARAECGASPPGPRARALRVLRHQITGR